MQHVATVNSVACNASGVCGSAADDQCVRVWRVAEGGREPEWQTSVMLAHPGMRYFIVELINKINHFVF